MKNLNDTMWEENIYEIKFGGVNGLSFRTGQTLKIKSKERVITNITRDFINDEEVFMVFSAPKDNLEEVKITKFSKGEAVYITFDV